MVDILKSIMRILISGVAGFIGSHLAEMLLSQDHEVVGIDNFITGSRDNLSRLPNQSKFKLIERDLCDVTQIDGPVDRIYHLASPASPNAYAMHRVATMKVNSQGTWNLLELATEKNARFIISSTSEIYGEPLTPTQREDYWGNVNPIGLRSVYEEAKRFSEAVTMAYHRERGTDTRIVRIFNCYGPRMGLGDGRVVSTFVMQAIKGEPITIYGDGTQTRSFCHISDTLRGMTAAMESDFHEPINIGNPHEMTVMALAREIIALVPGSPSKVVFEPSPAYDPKFRKPDISRARQILNWTPKMSPREGLAGVVQYYKELTKNC